LEAWTLQGRRERGGKGGGHGGVLEEEEEEDRLKEKEEDRQWKPEKKKKKKTDMEDVKEEREVDQAREGGAGSTASKTWTGSPALQFGKGPQTYRIPLRNPTGVPRLERGAWSWGGAHMALDPPSPLGGAP
jgi:hypothetical protein